MITNETPIGLTREELKALIDAAHERHMKAGEEVTEADEVYQAAVRRQNETRRELHSLRYAWIVRGFHKE